MRYPALTKPTLPGAACGAFAITFIGFSQLGWKTSHGAADMAQEQADAAAVTALVPFCVAKAKQPSQQAMLAKVKAEAPAFSRGELVRQAGWTRVGTSKTPDNAVVIVYANSLRTAKRAA